MAKLIYQAGFESEALDAAGGDSADTLGPMQLTQGPEVPGSAIDKLTMLASPPRAQFTLTRAKDFPVNDLKTNCYVGAVVYPFSWNVPYFKVRATFELPDWQSTATKFGWAAAVFYRKGDAVPRVLGGLGVAVLSTSQGLMTDREARKRKVGGEVLCYVW